MNGAIVVFHDSKIVIDSIKRYYAYISQKGEGYPAVLANERLVNIFVAMYNNIGIEEHVGEDFQTKYLTDN